MHYFNFEYFTFATNASIIPVNSLKTLTIEKKYLTNILICTFETISQNFGILSRQYVQRKFQIKSSPFTQQKQQQHQQIV